MRSKRLAAKLRFMRLCADSALLLVRELLDKHGGPKRPSPRSKRWNWRGHLPFKGQRKGTASHREAVLASVYR